MIARSAFDEEFFKVPCFRLAAPLKPADLKQLPAGDDVPFFADAKAPASELAAARMLLTLGFRKICTQVELVHRLDAIPVLAQPAEIRDRLLVTNAEIEVHAAHFETSRFRQDPLIPPDIAVMLYAKWIRNSLSGRKRVACIGSSFCTFADSGAVRSIDLLSIMEKRRGLARAILLTLLTDARSRGCTCVRVTTEAENVAALAAYRSTEFEIEGFTSVFHRYVARSDDGRGS